MATVKALVDLFERRSATASSIVESTRSSLKKSPASVKTSEQVELGAAPEPDKFPAQSPRHDVPPRLLVHPLLRRREPSGTDDTDDLVFAPSATVQAHFHKSDDIAERTADITDEALTVTGRSNATVLSEAALYKESLDLSRTAVDDDARHNEMEMDSLLPVSYASPSGMFISPSDAFSSAILQPSHSFASSATLVPGPSPHTPVPVSTIFARKAAPLYLPKVDDYISSIPAAAFPLIQKEEDAKGTSASMFPPMDRLAATGKTLADLEHNSVIAPGWRNCSSILASLTSIALGVTGSSLLASFYSVQGLFDTVQIFALILSTLVSHRDTEESGLRTLLLVKIPNLIALNFGSNITQSLILLVGLMIFAGMLLYYFHRVTCNCCYHKFPEGMQQIAYPKHAWLLVIVSFLLTVLYLPISTMAVHVLVWSDDLWVVPNPYVNATSNPPNVPPLGPADQFRAPLDFCWTTTMELDQFNYAPFIVIIAIGSFIGLTIWFPIYLYRATKQVVPVVDPYTELGVRRSRSDMDREYQRLLDRDRNPFSFLYNGFRRGWGTYECVFLLAKLTTLLITDVVDPDNCLFRTLSQSHVVIARQVVLLATMLLYFVLQCIFAPFLDPVGNASEWTSRMNYVLTSALALAVAFNIPDEAADILNGPVLYVIYFITYGLSLYFTVINMDLMRRLVKRLARRIDFSIDIFSPRIDLTPSSPHVKRRIWQEALTTLILTNFDCRIPKSQLMEFAQATDNEYPPYLLRFAGSPGERHVENLKILRDVGSMAYYRAVKLVTGPESPQLRQLEAMIQKHFVGPDCYWRPHAEGMVPYSSFFGTAWWIPFPPTLVIHYDDGALKTIRDVSQFELYVMQNSSHHVQRRREVRLALRALDGQVVRWPHDYTKSSCDDEICGCCRRQSAAGETLHYEQCSFNIKRRGELMWDGVDFGSGFELELVYTNKVKSDGSAIGLTDDFEMTRPLARFLAMNRALLETQMVYVEAILRSYRHHHRRECEWKQDTLTYRFLTAVYDQPRPPADVTEVVLKLERDPRVQELFIQNETALGYTYERLTAVCGSALSIWWYIFWDDLWRRNYETMSALRTYASDFDPHYLSSIAYKPLPRPALEAFLAQRGLLHRVPKWGDFFTAGFLNKMYVRMNDIIFHGSSEADVLHLGEDTSELDMEEVDVHTLLQPSTLGTGAGTDYDDSSIRARPVYRWEGILEDPVRSEKAKHRSLLRKLAVWFGVSPFWRPGLPSEGISLDVRLENGRYILFEDAQYGWAKDDLEMKASQFCCHI
ncbi:uncharacterized protein LAESUDRAFT_729889 [Laetiporus sulphureus 93-53]|uniref:Uncharacterized protein n=1 Tax=Laetiporus sulphureus 93-53 TaxID=1314785 RepID=A0A165CE46_9APHY|nr:uncharacterized protein LAESUDRAFT_729889 [Laetiporus sulphureus 93-53]KZT02648.1 hypothetical protein LAESUDRAFT_729889 [Laetiporus sulphureus 93-53]